MSLRLKISLSVFTIISNTNDEKVVLFADVIIGTHGMEFDRVGLLVDLTPCFNTDKDFF